MVETSKLFLQDLDWAMKMKSSVIDPITAMDSQLQASESLDSTLKKPVTVNSITSMDSQLQGSETLDSTLKKPVAVNSITSMDSQLQASETLDSTLKKTVTVNSITSMDSQLQASETLDSTLKKPVTLNSITAMDSQLQASESLDSTLKKTVTVNSITSIDSQLQASETLDSTLKKPVTLNSITAMDSQLQASETLDSTLKKTVIVNSITSMDSPLQASETLDSTLKKPVTLNSITAMDSQLQASETLDSTLKKPVTLNSITAMDSQLQASETLDSTLKKTVTVNSITSMDSQLQASETLDSTLKKTVTLNSITSMDSQLQASETLDSTLKKSVTVNSITSMDSQLQASETLDSTLKKTVTLNSITAMDSQLQASETLDSTLKKTVTVNSITSMDSQLQASETLDSTLKKSVTVNSITSMDSQLQASETLDSTLKKTVTLNSITSMDSPVPDSSKEKSVINTFTAMDIQTTEPSNNTKDLSGMNEYRDPVYISLDSGLFAVQEIKKGDEVIISITPVTIKTGNDQQSVNKDEVIYVAERLGCSTQQEMNSTIQQKLDSPIEITQGFDFDDEDLDEQHDKNDPDYVPSSEEQLSDKSLEDEFIHSLNKIHNDEDSVARDSDTSMEDEHGEASNILHWPALEKKSPNSIQENKVIRDVSNPGIYVRKVQKSKKASKAQMKSKKAENERVYDNFHSCLFCGGMRQHISSHMYVHKNIPKVKEILAKEKKDFSKLRKQGDNKHNKKVVEEGKGELILSRRPESNAVVFDSSQYGPCINCYEWLLFKNMKRHLEACTMQTVTMSRRQIVIMSQVEAGVLSTKPSNLMLNEVFPSMIIDKVSEVAKKDETIVALGESWLRRSIDNREKRRYYTSQHMRLMGKMLLELRSLEGEDEKDFEYYLHPSRFDMLVGAALQCCLPYMDDMEELKAPSNGIKIKYDLRRMITARWAITVKKDVHSLCAKELKTCLELIKMEWGERITKLARSVLVRRSFQVKHDLPSPEDIRKLTSYLIECLKAVDLKEENYSRIVQLSQTRILMYNKRRSGEVDAISLNSYASKTKDVDDLDESLVGELSKVELHLLKSQDLMKVRGKGNRPVPVLIPADLKGPLDFLASSSVRKQAGIPEANCYLFPVVSKKSGLNPARSYESLKKTCTECSLAAPNRITSVSMRKYTATLTQMLNLDGNQLEWVCRHLGHSANVHKTHYRQMSGFIERVHVSKLMLVQDMNLTKKYAGKKLEDIDITDIVLPSEETDGSDEGDENEDCNEGILVKAINKDREDRMFDINVFEDDEEELEEEEDVVEEDCPVPSHKQTKQKKPVVVRKRWNEIEMAEIRKYFKSYLDAGICPRTEAVEKAKKKSMKDQGKIWMRSNDKIIKKISNMNHKK
ncbi:Hypothetical predicted protein [Mytilus galloprovincialis]|uniref:Uncharacterized protein n=1 Tax=Mytilus galloprovincialis TaxID=29158 RepID=A0A8B6FAP4_MYTGA|nr:Hypothetical predicted protein [Mytilus galloprovincialis]